MTDDDPSRQLRGVTLHLAPEAVWLAQEEHAEYRPENFAAEGFVHCTDGEDLVLEVANRYYRDDRRPFVLLDVDLSKVRARAIYEDDARCYPHIHGPLDKEAVRRVRRMRRSPDGVFTGIVD
jgi:uncharacterized protein (DUF952 family)